MSDEQHAGAHEHHAHEHHHAVNYTAIFIVLCVCTLISIVVDLSKEHLTYPVLAVLILAVAISKATFVILYFMHIKFERAWKYVLLAPTGVLACALPFALAPDIAFHYYNVIVPQTVAEEEDFPAAHIADKTKPVDHATQSHGTSDVKHHDADGHGTAEHPEAGHKDADHKHEKGAADHKPAAPAEKAHK